MSHLALNTQLGGENQGIEPNGIVINQNPMRTSDR